MPPAMPVIQASGNLFVTGSLEANGVALYCAKMVSLPPATGKLVVGVGDAPGIGVPKPSVTGVPSVVKGVGAGDGVAAGLGICPLVWYWSFGVQETAALPESKVMEPYPAENGPVGLCGAGSASAKSFVLICGDCAEEGVKATPAPSNTSVPKVGQLSPGPKIGVTVAICGPVSNGVKTMSK